MTPWRGCLGGDEFTVILENISNIADAENVAEKILLSLRQPFQLGIQEVYVTASIGITLFPQDATTAERLLKNADQAMYAAKDAGRNGFSFFRQAQHN